MGDPEVAGDLFSLSLFIYIYYIYYLFAYFWFLSPQRNPVMHFCDFSDPKKKHDFWFRSSQDGCQGLGRVSSEHWVQSHPQLQPCDLDEQRKGQKGSG